jgi:hypothetical protein
MGRRNILFCIVISIAGIHLQPLSCRFPNTLTLPHFRRIYYLSKYWVYVEFTVVGVNVCLVFCLFLCVCVCVCVCVAQQPNSGSGRLIVDVSRSHTIRHTHTHTHGRTPLNEWSALRRSRYLHNTINARDDPCCLRDSNQRCQQSSVFRPIP